MITAAAPVPPALAGAPASTGFAPPPAIDFAALMAGMPAVPDRVTPAPAASPTPAAPPADPAPSQPADQAKQLLAALSPETAPAADASAAPAPAAAPDPAIMAIAAAVPLPSATVAEDSAPDTDQPLSEESDLADVEAPPADAKAPPPPAPADAPTLVAVPIAPPVAAALAPAAQRGEASKRSLQEPAATALTPDAAKPEAGDAADTLAAPATSADRGAFAALVATAVATPAPDPSIENEGATPAPDLADRAIAHRLSAEQDAQSLDSLARDIARAATPGAKLSFAVVPDALGTVGVELQQSERGTAIRLTSDSEEGRQILVDAQPRLVQEARAQGLRIAETHVDLGHRHDGGGRHHPPAPQQPRAAAAALADPTPRGGTMPTATPSDRFA